jgi:hypothetical protein
MTRLTGWFYYDPDKNSVTFVADNPNLYPVSKIDWEILQDPTTRQAFIDHFKPSQHRKDGRVRAFAVEWEEAEIIAWLDVYKFGDPTG